jgi:beta-lactam-binding protein with PASTA domain
MTIGAGLGRAQSPATKVYARAIAGNAHATEMVTVPDVNRETYSNAVARLKQVGLHAQIEEIVDPLPLIVKEQAPRAGSSLPRNGDVILTLEAAPVNSAAKPPTPEVIVPSVAHRSLHVARALLERVGLVAVGPGDGTELPPPPQEGGLEVAKQSPTSGMRTQRGSVVELTLGQAPAQSVAVPRVLDDTLADAEDILKARGLAPRLVTESRQDPEIGLVTAQDPEAGRRVPRGSTVTVTSASSSPHMETVPEMDIVPDLTGQTLAGAQSILSDHFVLRVTERPRDAAALIVRQSPNAGSKRASGTEVFVFLTPQPPGVPWVWLLGSAIAVGLALGTGFKLSTHSLRHATTWHLRRTIPNIAVRVHPSASPPGLEWEVRLRSSGEHTRVAVSIPPATEVTS